MNQQIKTDMGKSASLMRIAAIAAMVSQVVSIASSVVIGGKLDGIGGSIIPIILAAFLLQGANSQEEYANKGGKEEKLLEGIQKEIVYWRTVTIFSLIGTIFIGLMVISVLIGGEPIIKGFIHGLARVGGGR